MRNVLERCLFWFNFKLHKKSLWNFSMHACLQFIWLPWVCMNARGLSGWLIYLGLSSFFSLNLYSKACGAISKGWLLKKYLCKEERNILRTERKVLYSVIHKPSKIPVAWQEKMFLLLFYFFKHQSFDFYSSGSFQGSHCYFLEQSHCQWKSVICTGFLFL